jgi:hypothetical protein
MGVHSFGDEMMLDNTILLCGEAVNTLFQLKTGVTLYLIPPYYRLSFASFGTTILI